MEVKVTIKEATINEEQFFFSFYKEDEKVVVFSIMTDKKGK